MSSRDLTRELRVDLHSHDVPPKYVIVYIDKKTVVDRKEGEIKYLKSKSKADNERKLWEVACPILNAWYDSFTDKHLIKMTVRFTTRQFGRAYMWGPQTINGYTYTFVQAYELIPVKDSESINLDLEPEPEFKTIILLEL
jgi:hypothetical protein